MTDAVQQALAADRVIDITTIGKKSGEPRRIEIWFHRVLDGYYITGTPGRPRSWYANLVAHPAFTFHLKGTTRADLAATARPVTEPAEREKVFGAIIAALPQLGEGAPAQAWIAGSPLVEVTFADA